MNILLILPLSDPFDEIVIRDKTAAWNRKNSVVQWLHPVPVTYPNGLLSLAAYAAAGRHDANIRILDGNLLLHKWAEELGEAVTSATREDFWEYCLGPVADFDPAVIGISLMFCGMQRDFPALVALLRKRYKDALITAGSHLASARPEMELRMAPELDAVCFGEGELPFAGLLAALRAGNTDAYLSGAKSWMTRDKVAHGFTPDCDFIENLDDIPPYDPGRIVAWELYPRYGRPLLFMETRGAGATFHMFTSRGCPGKCVFCASHTVHGRRVRHHSLARIKSDVLLYRTRYHVGAVDFYDDHFLHDKKKAIDILRFMKDNHIVTNVGNPAFFAVDDAIAAMLKEAGVEKTIIAVESANGHTLRKIIHKPGSLKRAEKAVRSLQNAGITVIGNILMGFPGETKEAIADCVRGMLELGCNWYSCFVVSPLPGSELFDICLKNDYFPADVNIYQMNFKKCVIQTEDFTPEYIERKVYETNLFVNYVNNYDMRLGNYAKALCLFESVLFDVIDTHAFAYYYAAICAEKLNIADKYSLYKNKYNTMLNVFSFWRDWRNHFALPELA